MPQKLKTGKPGFTSVSGKAREKTHAGRKPGETTLVEKPFIPIIVVLVLTFLAFLPSLKNGFIATWDDNVYITDNPLIRHLNLSSIRNMFTTPVNGTYIPVPLLSFAVENRFFGLNPVPYHITNLFLHLLCTLFAFIIFRKLKFNIYLAAFSALVFGIHPMRVESVAWVTERKDLLFCLFYLASLIMYLKYLPEKRGRIKFLLFSIGFFILSLFSKIQAVTLPLSLLLIDYLLERPLKTKLILEKIPYFALSVVFGIFGILILADQGPFSSIQYPGLLRGILTGSYTLVVYLFKFIAPFHLSAMYPLGINEGQSLPWLFYLSPALLIIAGYFLYRSARKTRVFIFGSLFFLVNVIFVLQIVRVGTAFTADRFTYVPYFGLIFMTAWMIREIMNRNRNRKTPVIVVVSGIMVLFAVLTYNRCKTWLNDETLWNDVIEKYPDESEIPYSNRAVFYNSAGLWDKTISDCSRAVKINPNDARAYTNRGVAYSNTGEADYAISDFSKALSIDSGLVSAWSNRGAVYLTRKEPGRAIADLTTAIRIKPDDVNAFINRGLAFKNNGEFDKALADFSKALELNPSADKAYLNRGAVYGSMFKLDKALADYSSAIRINPGNAKAYFNRGYIYDYLQQYEKAAEDYSTAITIDPTLNVAYSRREAALRKLQEKQGK